jgi:uncharacterized membrane protein YecN with MAPEG domain
VESRAPIYEDGALLMEEVFLAKDFRCHVCGLVLSNIEELHVAGLAPRFSRFRATDLHELFQPELEEEYQNM